LNALKKFDKKFLDSKHKIIAAVLSTTVKIPYLFAIAVIASISATSILGFVNDSKKITEKNRELLYVTIIKQATDYSVGIVNEKTIDKINILQATMLAMKIAVDGLSTPPDLVLIDGNKTFDSELDTVPIIKGDSLSFSIAAASIVAKVTRDKIMRTAAKKYPQYLWHKNKGYGTKEHIAAIKKHGPTPLHRISFLNNILDL